MVLEADTELTGDELRSAMEETQAVIEERVTRWAWLSLSLL